MYILLISYQHGAQIKNDLQFWLIYVGVLLEICFKNKNLF